MIQLSIAITNPTTWSFFSSLKIYKLLIKTKPTHIGEKSMIFSPNKEAKKTYKFISPIPHQVLHYWRRFTALVLGHIQAGSKFSFNKSKKRISSKIIPSQTISRVSRIFPNSRK